MKILFITVAAVIFVILISVVVRRLGVKSDYIPAHKRARKAFISPHGLYPHEILALYFSGSYSDTKSKSDYPKYWYYYGVKDVPTLMRSLLARGFLQTADLRFALEQEKVDKLKDVLKQNGLKVSGKKEELIERLLNELPREKTESLFSDRPLQPTEVGSKAIADEDYVIYAHKNSGQLEGLDIWSLNRLVYTPPRLPLSDKIWGYFNERAEKLIKELNYIGFVWCRITMARFAIDDKRFEDALELLSEAAVWDLSGLKDLALEIKNAKGITDTKGAFFYQTEPILFKLPAIIAESMNDIKNGLEMADNEFRSRILSLFEKVETPIHPFEPTECVDIVLSEMAGEGEKADKISERGLKRFSQTLRKQGIKKHAGLGFALKVTKK
ncbi:hypothetical protein FACS189487_01990 [Campylobacterota bacterium]|nr:hypothetical protein FACS189487_01990 [Campylobacterota bacterium]